MMNLVRSITFLALVVVLTSCTTQQDNVILINKVKHTDHLIYRYENTFNLNTISSISTGDYEVIISDSYDYSIYFLNYDFSINKYFIFKDQHYLFSGEIKYLTKYKNSLFIIDESWDIKIFDLDTYSIDYFTLKPPIMNQITNITFIDDSLFAIGGVAIMDRKSSENAQFTVAGIFNRDGSINRLIQVDYNKLNHKHPFPFDLSYVTYNKGILYVIFTLSPQIITYSLQGDMLNIFTMLKPPYFEQGSHTFETLSNPFTNYPLTIRDDVISLFQSRGGHDEVYINQYDLEFNILKRYKADIILPGKNYGFIFNDNHIIMADSKPFDRTSIYKFEIQSE